MRKITKVVLLTIGIFGLFVTPRVAFAQWAAMNPLCVSGPANDIATIKGLECMITLILRVLVGFAGVASLVMIILGGFQYLTSGGNPENTKKAQSTLTWGIAGMAVLLGSWLILKFIQVLTNVDVTQFVIPS